MSNHINFFKTLSPELEGKILFEGSQYKFSFEKDGINHSLSTGPLEDQEIRNSQIYIKEEDSNWSQDENNLEINRFCIINNPAFLFGNNGLVGPKSTLGIALSWHSKSSNQRGVVPVGELVKGIKNEPFEFQVKYNFKPGQLKGLITFELILYLKENKHQNIPFFAQHEGTLLGELDSCTLIIDGSGSMFPILEVHNPNKPLWWVSCDWMDILSDPFTEEYVSVNLNTAHRFFKQLNVEYGLGSSPLLIEIISSSIQIIIQKAKETDVWDVIQSGVDLDPGSIAQAVNYFLQTFQWDHSSPENLACSIRNDLESRI